MSELSRYGVIDCLEIGPVELTPCRVRARYQVTVDGLVHETTFSYRFAEAVFDPKDASSRHLAAMMAVQPALNYGLFCRRMVFHDVLSEVDRRFIMAMMENTSREILVGKLHRENRFLLPGWQLERIPRQERYTLAELEFNEKAPQPLTDSWTVRDEGFCVLSSGGKESLLSHGLIRELGADTHPIYINESGRHWFTALNGYRSFVQNDPRTSRVWTDCDRLFTWMLRRIRFIRPDFQRLRADDYPLRLWTVAVFLFGALPLLRKRGLGHLVVGNEFDTSRYFADAPLPHYDGLFDQSLWFDQALRAYFRENGWGIRVCSILRNLSETLVETVLSRRYPELFAAQVSCHAALIRGERVYPCGRCEKCRRIIAILTAIGGDPGIIGYTPDMCARGLRTLREQGLHSQLPGEFSQVLALLDKNPEPQEIEDLRIDDETSPLSEIPVLLRKPLMTLLSSYTRGTLRRERGRGKGEVINLDLSGLF